MTRERLSFWATAWAWNAGMGAALSVERHSLLWAAWALYSGIMSSGSLYMATVRARSDGGDG